MKEGDLDVYTVDGLGLSMQRKDPCNLVFCKGRNMNEAHEFPSRRESCVVFSRSNAET